jgi:hypothetical protein
MRPLGNDTTRLMSLFFSRFSTTPGIRGESKESGIRAWSKPLPDASTPKLEQAEYHVQLMAMGFGKTQRSALGTFGVPSAVLCATSLKHG